MHALRIDYDAEIMLDNQQDRFMYLQCNYMYRACFCDFDVNVHLSCEGKLNLGEDDTPVSHRWGQPAK
jgi:hypothetical protein